MSTGGEYRNIHGRKPGRGLRPWLLIPKYVCAAVFLGGLVSLLVLTFGQPTPTTPAEWKHFADTIHRAYARLIVPALIGAMVLGIVLGLAHPLVFVRMRWLQLKLLLVAAGVPALHLFMSHRSIALREAVTRADFATAATLRQELLYGTIAAALFAFVVIVLGRLKPRLAQKFAPAQKQPRPDSNTNIDQT